MYTFLVEWLQHYLAQTHLDYGDLIVTLGYNVLNVIGAWKRISTGKHIWLRIFIIGSNFFQTMFQIFRLFIYYRYGGWCNIDCIGSILIHKAWYVVLNSLSLQFNCCCCCLSWTQASFCFEFKIGMAMPLQRRTNKCHKKILATVTCCLCIVNV